MGFFFFADASDRANGGADPSAPPAEGALLDQEPGAAPAAGVPGDPPQELPTMDEGVGSDVRDSLELMLPWMTSLLAHLAIVILALFIVWSVVEPTDEDDTPIIPTARLSENPGGALSQSQDVELQSTQNIRQVQSENVSTSDSLATLDKSIDSEMQLVGLSGGASGKLAPFGTTTGGEGSLAANFYGTGGNARKIAYVVDASGSLIDTLPFVKKELKDSINGLNEQQQQFTVIFFQAGEPIEVPPPGWKPATPENKRKAFDFIDDPANIVARGRTDPQKAIKLAMKYKPELMFILSDNITGRGQYEVDREELLRFLNTENKDRKTTINTIQFLYEDKLNTLKDIAAEHGGVSKFVTDADLGLGGSR